MRAPEGAMRTLSRSSVIAMHQEVQAVKQDKDMGTENAHEANAIDYSFYRDSGKETVIR